MSDTQSVGEEGAKAEFRRKLKLAFASIGVVFGDIGTSPLYAMRESLAHVAGAGGNVHEDVLAVVSLLIWALILIVTIKYVLILMRAEGWSALERYSLAMYGHGIRRIHFPAGLASLKHSEVLHANLARLPELKAVQFGNCGAPSTHAPSAS